MDEIEERPLAFQQFIAERISELVIKKGISENKMSLALGKGGSYIRAITNKRAWPSFKGFIDICDYLDITVEEFFAGFEVQDPQKYKLQERIRTLDAESVQKLLELLDWADK